MGETRLQGSTECCLIGQVFQGKAVGIITTHVETTCWHRYVPSLSVCFHFCCTDIDPGLLQSHVCFQTMIMFMVMEILIEIFVTWLR